MTESNGDVQEPGRNARKTAYKKEESRIGLLTILSVLIGFVAGFIAFLLYHFIGFLTNIFYYQRLSFSFSSPEFNHLGLFAIIMPIIGGLIAGLMVKYGSTRIIGHGIPEAMESILLNRSKIEPKVGILKAISAAFTIGSGQPFGAEGPIIQTGGAFGSFVGQLMSFTGSERKILLSAGAAAGMAATFGTPISAILLVVELLLFEFRVKSLVPVGVASAIGGWMHIYLIQSAPLFQTPPYNFGNVEALPYFVVLGFICGVIGTALSRSLYVSEDLFKKLPFRQPWLPALGGLAVGVIGFAVPAILGVGYSVIMDILSGKLIIETILLIMIAKSAAWILSMGSQTSGGTLAPLFMVGSAVGFAYGDLLNYAIPGFGLVPGVFAVAAMGSVFGTASRAPFTSIVFTLEVTGAFQGVLPVIVAAVVAELVGEYLMEDSIMTEKLARRGLRVRHIYEYNPLRQIRVSQLMSKPLSAVNADQKVLDVYKQMSTPGHVYWNRKRLIVVRDDKAIGVVDREQVYLGAANADPELKVEKICSENFFTIREDELGYEAQSMMSLNDVAFLVVVDKNANPVGYISRGDLSRAQKGKIMDETIREGRMRIFGWLR